MPWSSETAAKTAAGAAKNAWTKPQSTKTSPSPWQTVKNGTQQRRKCHGQCLAQDGRRVHAEQQRAEAKGRAAAAEDVVVEPDVGFFGGGEAGGPADGRRVHGAEAAGAVIGCDRSYGLSARISGDGPGAFSWRTLRIAGFFQPRFDFFEREHVALVGVHEHVDAEDQRHGGPRRSSFGVNSAMTIVPPDARAANTRSSSLLASLLAFAVENVAERRDAMILRRDPL